MVNRYEHIKNNDNKTFKENNINFKNKIYSITNEIKKYGLNYPFLIYIDDNNEILNQYRNPSKFEPISIVYGQYGFNLNQRIDSSLIEVKNCTISDDKNILTDIADPSKNINYIIIKLPKDNTENNKTLQTYWSSKIQKYLDAYKINISHNRKLLIVYDFDCTLTSKHLWFSLYMYPANKIRFNNAFNTNDSSLIKEELEEYFGNINTRDNQNFIFNYMKNLMNPTIVTAPPLEVKPNSTVTPPLSVTLPVISTVTPPPPALTPPVVTASVVTPPVVTPPVAHTPLTPTPVQLLRNISYCY
jgi:hypothetical protein